MEFCAGLGPGLLKSLIIIFAENWTIRICYLFVFVRFVQGCHSSLNVATIFIFAAGIHSLTSSMSNIVIFNDDLLATLPLGSDLRSNTAFIVPIINVTTRLLLGLRRSLKILLFTAILRPALILDTMFLNVELVSRKLEQIVPLT